MEQGIGGLGLTPHPDTPPRAVPGVFCSYVWQGAGSWSFDFIVPVPPAALALPAACEPGRADGLWRTTCFELFLRDPDSERYLEFNFSPSGQWAAYAFDGYRSGMRALATTGPRILTADPDQFRLSNDAGLRALGLDEATIALMLDATPALEPPPQFALSAIMDDAGLNDGRRWLASVSAVIEESDGTKSYWALAHPPGAPDFHHPDCFVLDLAAPESP